MNLQNLFPEVIPELWDVLRKAARYDFLTVRPDPEHGALFDWHWDSLKDPDARSLFAGILQAPGVVMGGPALSRMRPLMWMWSLSRLFREGPKVFRPTPEQCESLENVDVGIPMSQYRQPFPGMVVSLPRGYTDSVASRAGRLARMPSAVLVRHWDAGAVMCGALASDVNGAECEFIYTFGGPVAAACLETGIKNFTGNFEPQEAAVAQLVTRVSMNLCLLLATHQTRLVSSDPKGVERARQKLGRGVRPDLQERAIAETVTWIVPHREIVVRQTRRDGPDGPPTGDTTRPHWVRGHWRAHPGYGAARQRGERVPLLFVRPYLTRSDAAGDGPIGAAYRIA